jgi:hypothetical protein
MLNRFFSHRSNLIKNTESVIKKFFDLSAYLTEITASVAVPNSK